MVKGGISQVEVSPPSVLEPKQVGEEGGEEGGVAGGEGEQLLLSASVILEGLVEVEEPPRRGRIQETWSTESPCTQWPSLASLSASSLWWLSRRAWAQVTGHRSQVTHYLNVHEILQSIRSSPEESATLLTMTRRGFLRASTSRQVPAPACETTRSAAARSCGQGSHGGSGGNLPPATCARDFL